MIILGGWVAAMVCASCSPGLTPAPTIITSPPPPPVELTLTSLPTSPPIATPVEIPALAPCPWAAYLNGETPPSLSNENCLDDLTDVGISGNEKQILFSVRQSSTLGTYGVCQDISGTNKLNFTVSIRDSIASARFLVLISPASDPAAELSRGFRIQAETPSRQEKEMWVTSSRYVLNGFENDGGKLQASLGWKHIDLWNFEFVFQFNGPKVSVSMYKTALSEHWQLNSSSRYLCFAYQAMPTADYAAELEATVTFP
jgi:hypothetical protein